MKPVTVEAAVAADPDRVYEVIIDVDLIPQISPDTVSVAFVGEQRSGPGTRFVETRNMGNKTQEFPLELRECDASARTARFVSDMHGTVWDTAMVVTSAGEGSHVRFTMAAHTDSMLKSFMFSLMSGVFRKAMNKQVTALKGYCER